MTLSVRQFGLLLAVGVISMIARTADAGFVSLADDSLLHAGSPFEAGSPATSSGMAPAKDAPVDVPSPLHWLQQQTRMAAHPGGPIGAGGMSSSTTVGGAPQSPALNSTPELPPPALVTRLVVRDELPSPRVVVDGLLRPPRLAAIA